jgi:ABC-type uncharacterized transport system YnjBCD substrate-binding protein
MHQAVQFSEGHYHKEMQLLDEQTLHLQHKYETQLEDFRNLKMSHVSNTSKSTITCKGQLGSTMSRCRKRICSLQRRPR